MRTTKHFNDVSSRCKHYTLSWFYLLYSITQKLFCFFLFPPKTSNLIATEILRCDDLVTRVAVIEKWVAVADICRCLHNYNAVLEITSSLNRSSVFRLKKTWLKVSKQVLHFLLFIFTIWLCLSRKQMGILTKLTYLLLLINNLEHNSGFVSNFYSFCFSHNINCGFVFCFLSCILKSH